MCCICERVCVVYVNILCVYVAYVNVCMCMSVLYVNILYVYMYGFMCHACGCVCVWKPMDAERSETGTMCPDLSFSTLETTLSLNLKLDW